MATTAPAYTPLAPEQRRLLLAALSSYRKTPGSTQQSNTASPSGTSDAAATPRKEPSMSTTDTISPSVFENSVKATNDLLYDFGSLDNNEFDFDLDDAAAQGRGSIDDTLAGFAGIDADAQGEKRKSPEEDSDDDDDDNDAKRHEGEEKGSKKPGRKPLTSEPTTKRKAQNRAAQRAFRERKEKHLKDLETKVADLEKASESANHENSILRAQVERLQDELKDYKRRMSTASAPMNSSPTSARTSMSTHRQSTGNSIDEFDFSFDFSRFGENGNNNSVKTNALSNSNPASDGNPFTTPGSVSAASNDAMGNMFGTSFFDGMNNKPVTKSPGGFSSKESPSGLNWASPANSNSNSTASQSPSNSNQNMASSSCCTSPDETNWALGYQKNGANADTTFPSLSNTPGLTNAKTPESISGASIENNNFDWLNTQNGTFDPVLFGDYREPQDNIIGTGEFTGGFFEDGLNFPDFNDSFNFNTSTDTTIPAPVSAAPNGLFNAQQPPQKPGHKATLLDKVAEQRDGGDQYDKQLVLPGEVEKKQPSLMACYKIWNQLQNCPRFHSGDFDIDNLCSELASKATCTETGLAIEKDKVEAALWKLASQGPGQNGESTTA